MKNILLVLLIFITPTFSQSNVTFQVKGIPDSVDISVGIRGSITPLSWSKSIALEKFGEMYRATLAFPQTSIPLEFKFVLFKTDDAPIWESTQNRTLTLSAGETIVSDNIWDKEQVIDIQSLEKLTPEQLLDDYRIIEIMVKEIHPGTYRYKSETQINAALSELKSKFNTSLSYGEAYLAMSKLTAFIQCDHTKVGFTNQNKIINSIIHYQQDKLPFTFRWLNNKMIVLYNASESKELKRGTEILKINRAPVAEIRQRMFHYIAADGATDHNRIYKMQVNGYDFRYNAFDIFYPLLYPLTSRNLELEIQQPGEEKSKTVHVKTLTREERSEKLYERYADFPKTRDDLWSFEKLNDDTALLTVNSFGLLGWKRMTLDYKAFLKNIFDQLQQNNMSNLIIDVRKNAGGNDEMKDELFGYLTPDIRHDFKREGRTRYVSFPESVKPYIKTWEENPWYFNLNPPKTTPTDGYYIFKNNFTAKPLKNNKPIYQGNVYLLSSAANTSLAFYVVNQFKQQNIGTIIGQETGGNLNDINGGTILFLILPNSQIEIDVPIMGGFTLAKQPNSGVQPDIETTHTIEDIISNRDVELKTALRVINEKKRK